MPLQNRVTPFSTLIAVPARGRWFGNRGCLHNARGQIRRAYATTRWIFCELEFKGRRRPLLQPGRYTELFFLDEATALAAGHRPCAECMRWRFDRFRAAWAEANPAAARGARPTATILDEALHAERLRPDGRQATYRARLGQLPPGAMVEHAERAFLVTGAGPCLWSPSGYAPAQLDSSLQVAVLTPASVVRTLAAGYQPDIHPSADGASHSTVSIQALSGTRS
jgi:hypothetical protein